MKIQQVLITPKMANDFLQLNTKNRNLRPTHIRHLARLMKEGRWVEDNGDTICISGRWLIDGQHRLHAIILSGRSIRCIVVTEVPGEAFMTKDIGSRRNAADTLSILGYKTSNRVAATANYIYGYRTRGTFQGGGTQQLSPAEVVEFVKSNSGITDSVAFIPDSFRLTSRSLIAACHFLFREVDVALADTYVNKLTHGDGVLMTDPAFIVRERMINSFGPMARIRPHVTAAYIVKGWNATRQGATIKNLRFQQAGERQEAFPKIM